MKPPLLKSLWSYITDVHIESMSSDYNEELHVLLSKGRYQLCTPNAIYSYGDKYDNFTETFNQLRLDDTIKDVLILGFGLGSIPYMLEKKYGKRYSYTGVEIDDTVIYLASKYVLDDLKSEVQIINADAWNFVQLTEYRYDMICVDIFIDDKIPKIFLTTEFLEIIQSNLTENGILLFNHLGMRQQDADAAMKYHDEIFNKQFPNSVALKVVDNYMMLNNRNHLK
jgi:spermidine synthase